MRFVLRLSVIMIVLVAGMSGLQVPGFSGGGPTPMPDPAPGIDQPL
jgi:hypothetical protein